MVTKLLLTLTLLSVAFAQNCTKPLDLVLLIDSSGSVGSTGFKQMISFTQQMVNAFDIGSTKTRIGITEFSKTVGTIVRLDQGTNKANILKKVKAMKWLRSYTYMASALDHVRNNQLPKYRSDPNLAKVFVMFTDGVSTQRGSILTKAFKNWATARDKVPLSSYVIGVGRNVNENELKSIATSDKHVVKAENYANLVAILSKLIQDTCEAPPDPKVEPTPECSCKWGQYLDLSSNTDGAKCVGVCKSCTCPVGFKLKAEPSDKSSVAAQAAKEDECEDICTPCGDADCGKPDWIFVKAAAKRGQQGIILVRQCNAHCIPKPLPPGPACDDGWVAIGKEKYERKENTFCVTSSDGTAQGAVQEHIYPTAIKGGAFQICGSATVDNKNSLSVLQTTSNTQDKDSTTEFSVYMDFTSTDGRSLVRRVVFSPDSKGKQSRCKNVVITSDFVIKSIRTHLLLRNYKGTACFGELDIKEIGTANLVDDFYSLPSTNSLAATYAKKTVVNAEWLYVSKNTRAIKRGLSQCQVTQNTKANDKCKKPSASGIEHYVDGLNGATAFVWNGCISNVKIPYLTSKNYNKNVKTAGAIMKIDVRQKAQAGQKLEGTNKKGIWHYGVGYHTFSPSGKSEQCSGQQIVRFGKEIDLIRVQLLVSCQGQADFSNVQIHASTGCAPQTPATTHGDPHMLTLDRLKYDLMAHGEFQMTDDEFISSQVRMSQAGTSAASVNSGLSVQHKASGLTATVIRNDDGKLNPTVYVAGSKVLVNDGISHWLVAPSGEHVGFVTVEGSLTASDDQGDDEATSLKIVISFPSSGHSFDIQVFTSTSGVQYLGLNANLPTTVKGKVTGLLGNFDDDATNDLAAKTGVVLDSENYTQKELYDTFAASWRLGTNSHFDYEPGQTTFTFQRTDFPLGLNAAAPSDEAVTRATQVCSSQGLSPEALEECIFDVSNTGDDSFAKTAGEFDAIDGFAEEFIVVSDEETEEEPQATEEGSANGAIIAGVIIAVVVVIALIVIIAVVVIIKGSKKTDKGNDFVKSSETEEETLHDIAM